MNLYASHYTQVQHYICCRNAKSSQEVVAFVRSRLSAKRDDDTTLGQLLENICEEV